MFLIHCFSLTARKEESGRQILGNAGVHDWLRLQIVALSPAERPGPRPILPQAGSRHPCFRRCIQVRSGSLRCFSGSVRRFLRPYHLLSERDHSIRKQEFALLNLSVGGYKIDVVMPHAHARRSSDFACDTVCPERQGRLGARKESAMSVPDKKQRPKANEHLL